MLKLATKFAPQPDAFEQAHRAGFRCAELWLDAAVLARWREVLALAGDYPFAYALHFPNRLAEPAPALEQTVELYRGLASSCLVIHQPMLDRHGAALRNLEPDLRLAVENHKLTPEGFAAWAENSPGLALDVEHLWKLTLRDGPLPALLDEVRRLLRRCGDKLRHVHLPGYLPGYAEHRPMYCARDMAWPVLALLQEVHFEGLIVSETLPEHQNPEELRMDVLLFDAWRRSARAGERER
jgi:hypothetical protein